jgi:hypothetical protein
MFHIVNQSTDLDIINVSYTKKILDKCKFAEIDVLTEVVTKSSIFWDITPGSPLKVNRSFGGTSHLLFQGQRIKQSLLLYAGFLLGLFFDPVNRGDMFLRNVS